MSPEQASGRISAPPSDVFSLGILLFEMLQGTHPFQDLRPIDIVAKLQASDVAGELAPLLQPAYRPLLSQMLQRDPDLRPTADAVAELLAGIMPG
jgi:serine/threonine protein kinase